MNIFFSKSATQFANVNRVALFIVSLSLPVTSMVIADERVPAQPYVIASAEGSIEAYPDQVRLRISITDTATTLASAKQSVDELTDKVTAAAVAHGAKKEDVESSQIFASRHEEWQNNKQVNIGERVQRKVIIVSRDLTKYSELMQAIILVAKPAKYREVLIEQSIFEFQDQELVEHQALEQALIQVKNKAELMAKTLDAKLGRVYRITDASLSISPMPAYEMPMHKSARAMSVAADAGATASELLIGKQTITQSVQVMYLLTP